MMWKWLPLAVVFGLACTRSSLTEGLGPTLGGMDTNPGTDGGSPSGPVGPPTDNWPYGPHVAGSCTPMRQEPDRAVVLTLNHERQQDQLAILTLTSAGKLVDSAIRVDVPSNPRQVAVRADGREAAVAFGTITGDVGIAFLSLEPDGTDAALLQTLFIAQQQLTTGLAYVSLDKVVLTAAGGSAHTLYAIERGPDGKFVKGPTRAIPGGFAVQVLPRPATERALLVRAAAAEASTELLPIARWQDGWGSAGLSARVTPRAVLAVVHPSGNRVYVGTDAPNAAPPVPAGQIHSFRYAGDDLVAEAPFPLNRTAQWMAMAADGTYLVAQVPLLEPSPSGTGNIVYRYGLQTISLDSEGRPQGNPVFSDETFEGLFIHGFTLTPGGYLVVALELYPHQIVNGQAYPIKIFEQVVPGQWRQVCDTYWAPGQSTVGVAAFPAMR